MRMCLFRWEGNLKDFHRLCNDVSAVADLLIVFLMSWVLLDIWILSLSSQLELSFSADQMCSLSKVQHDPQLCCLSDQHQGG